MRFQYGMRERSRVRNWSSALRLLVPREEFKVEAVILERSYREALLEDRSNAGALKDTQEAQEPGWAKESGAQRSSSAVCWRQRRRCTKKGTIEKCKLNPSHLIHEGPTNHKSRKWDQ